MEVNDIFYKSCILILILISIIFASAQIGKYLFRHPVFMVTKEVNLVDDHALMLTVCPWPPVDRAKLDNASAYLSSIENSSNVSTKRVIGNGMERLKVDSK